MAVVETELSGGVLTVTLADEANRNARRPARRRARRCARRRRRRSRGPGRGAHQPGQRVLRGANLSERSSSDAPAAIRSPQALFGRFARSPKPYVGRIAGHCVAGGMGLAAAMDISIAVEDAKFGFTEVRWAWRRRSSRWSACRGRPADARAAFLRGRRFSAAEAASMGLINAAVPADRLDDEVDAVVSDLLAGGPGAIAAAKRLLAEVPATPVDEAFRWTGELSAQLFATEEARRGHECLPREAPGVLGPAGTGKGG